MEKHSLFLRLIIIEKFLLGLLFAAIGFGTFSLINRDMLVFTDHLVVFLNLDIEKAYVQELVDLLTNIRGDTIIGITTAMFVLGSLNILEGYGLHRRRRWAEWLTVIATSLFIPLEVYEVVQKQTTIRIGALVINVAIVYYLAKHKELFPKRMAWLNRVSRY